MTVPIRGADDENANFNYILGDAAETLKFHRKFETNLLKFAFETRLWNIKMGRGKFVA
jgi:hypothetical protein